MADTISIPTPKFKQGDQVYYIRSRDNKIFAHSYIVGWRVVYFSHGHSLTHYSVEFYDFDQCTDEPFFEPEVSADMIYDNLMEAQQKQLELQQKQYEALLEDLAELKGYIEATQTLINESETQQETQSDE